MTPRSSGVFRKQSSGDPQAAREVALRAFKEVPAYRRFLREQGARASLRGEDWRRLPVMDKRNYCLRHPYLDLIARGNKDALWHCFRSSGTTGIPQFWPRVTGAVASRFDWQATLDELFEIGRFRTLAIMGQAMGSWAGGGITYVGLHNIAFRRPGFTALCVGNKFDEIVDAAATLHPLYDRVLIFMVPSQIERFLEHLRHRKAAFPYAKCRFAITAEPFTEDFRLRVGTLCRASFPDVALAGHTFGSSDTGVLGDESRASIALRMLLHRSHRLRRALGVPAPVPNLYHIRAKTYLEIEGGELLFTQWDGVPLVRYNLHDRAEIWDWEALRRLIGATPVPARLAPLKARVARAAGMPDLMAYLGRSDGLKFHGAVLHYSDLDRALHHPRLARWSTGQFTVAATGSVRRRIRWDIELRSGVRASRKLAALFRGLLALEMSRMDVCFSSNYRQAREELGADPSARFFEIRLHRWPAISDLQSRHHKRRIASTR